jgi:hypothetical protein
VLVYGIDFSGARYAGRTIWIASGKIRKSRLEIQSCKRAGEVLGSGSRREKCLPALRKFIENEPDGVFGLDFPFGMPKELMREKSWRDFILSFRRRFPSAELFKIRCFKEAGNRELKRVTDREAETPFCVYNMRLYLQTYFGIREILLPMVQKDTARVLPMQRPKKRKPALLEICPASTLKDLGLYLTYKGKERRHREARGEILGELEKTRKLVIADRDMKRTVLDDNGGDALDSVLAALAASRRKRKCGSFRHVEGCVYV